MSKTETFVNIRLPWPDWKIVKYLGGGAYGKVYEIERNISGIEEKAAIKIISRPKDVNEIEDYYIGGYDKKSIIESYEEEIKNYTAEYKLMKELQGQSNIVSCDDFTIVPHEDGIGGDIFIRMELLTSLQQSLKNSSLPEDEIIKLGKDISRALILCEKRNIVHRDIKPQNILISNFGDYKLGDFGNSKVMNHTTYATTTGTSGFQAPEVVQMKKYGQTADIYSLGITLYWLLNNRKMPFIEASSLPTPIAASEALQKRYNGEKLPAPKNGSAELKNIVLKACEFRPEDRYASAKEMYDALDMLKSTGMSNSPTAKKTLNKTTKFGSINRKNEISKIAGMYFGSDEVHVAVWCDGACFTILKFPAVYTTTELGEVLTGTRAVRYQRYHSKKTLNSIFHLLADEYKSPMSDETMKISNIFMSELKAVLDHVVNSEFGEDQLELVVAIPSTDTVVQNNIRLLMQGAGLKIERIMSASSACALSTALRIEDQAQGDLYAVYTVGAGSICLTAFEFSDGVAEILYEKEIQAYISEQEDVFEYATKHFYEGFESIYGKEQNLKFFFCSDIETKPLLCDHAGEFEDISEAAVQGAALQGAKQSNMRLHTDFILLDIWRGDIGIEVINRNADIKFDMLESDCMTIPALKEICKVNCTDCSEINIYNIYRERLNSRSLLRNWKIGEFTGKFGSTPEKLELRIEISSESNIAIKASNPDNKEVRTFPVFDKKALSAFILNQQKEASEEAVKAELYQNMDIFCKKVTRFNTAQDHRQSSFIQGLGLIKRKCITFMRKYRDEKITDDNADKMKRYISELLHISDDIEIGIRSVSSPAAAKNETVDIKLLSSIYNAVNFYLERIKVFPIKAEGCLFDPDIHEAVDMVPVIGDEENVISEMIRCGYRYKGQLIRPAKVKVSGHMQSHESPEKDKEASTPDMTLGNENDNWGENETVGNFAGRSRAGETHDAMDHSQGNSWESTGTIGSPGENNNQNAAYRQSWHKPEDIVKPLYLFRTETLIGLTREITEMGKFIQLHIPRALKERSYIRLKRPDMQSGNLYYCIEFSSEKAKENLPDAEADTLISLDLNPDNIELLLQLGKLRQQRHMYEDAKNCFFKVLKEKADYLPAYIAIGDMFSELEDYQHASQWYKKAIRIDDRTYGLSADQCRTLYIEYARSEIKCKNYDEARKILYEAVKRKLILKKDVDNIGDRLGLGNRSTGIFSSQKK